MTKQLITQMREALLSAEIAVAELCQGQDPANQCWVTLQEVRDAIRAATPTPPRGKPVTVEALFSGKGWI